MDPLMDADTTALAEQVRPGEIAAWSDERRQDFCKTFHARSRVSRFLLLQTASRVVDMALLRGYMSERHVGKVFPNEGRNRWHRGRFPDGNLCRFDVEGLVDDGRVYWDGWAIGGRGISDLLRIATDRASAVLESLPSVKKALATVDPETAQKIERRDDLLDKAEVLLAELNGISKVVSLRSFGEKATIVEVLQKVADLDRKRAKVAKQLVEVGDEGSALDKEIHERLYKGIPGLTEAVVDVARQHIEQATALDALARRVEERVKFGDSESAMDLLARFEKDEREVSASIKVKLEEALARLKVAAAPKRVKKQVGGRS